MALHHPLARGPVVDVLKAVGDQFTKLYPPQFELQGIDRKADKLKSDHAIVKAVQAVTALFEVGEFEVYQSKRALMLLETTDPLSVCLSPDVVRRFNQREQRFIYGRAAMGLVDRTAVIRKLSPGEFGDVLGNSIRIHQPTYEGLGRRNDEQSKQLRRAYSRKALKLLEEPAQAALTAGKASVDALVQALVFSADRAGLLTCADLSAGLGLLLREEAPSAGQAKLDTAEAIAAALAQRPDVRELMSFALSDDFFRLRQRVGVSLG